jgi:L-lactate utilization protein LutB
MSINKSNIVVNELRPALHDAGFRTYLRYFGEFEHFEETTFQRKLQDYWSLPGLNEKGLGGSWDVQQRIEGLSSEDRRDYVALLGVNAISASDGSVYFLQHMSNISKDIQQAKKIILIVGIEKVVRDREEAITQSQSMGVFGLESMLLDLIPHDIEKYDFDALPLVASDELPSLHIIFYDNGRSALLEGDYRDLFLCIDCRACARQCPVGKYLGPETGMLYSPKNYLFAFLQHSLPSVEGCLHCGRCHVECPVDIDIPKLLWKSQLQHYEHHRRGWKKRMLDDPELLAKLGTYTAPLSTWTTTFSASRRLMQLFTGVHRDSTLPAFHRKTFRSWLKRGRHG